MLLENNTNRFIDLKALSSMLLLTDIRSAEKWCTEKKISINLIGGKKVVYLFLVEMELDKQLVSQLKLKYPQKWEELYKCYQDRDRIGYLLLIDEDPKLDFRPIAKKVSARSKRAKEFANS